MILSLIINEAFMRTSLMDRAKLLNSQNDPSFIQSKHVFQMIDVLKKRLEHFPNERKLIQKQIEVLSLVDPNRQNGVYKVKLDAAGEY